MKYTRKRREDSANKKRGFTVLMAVLVSILVLAIASSLVRIVLKQVKFSGSGRESQISYYVADTGIECALLWDFRSVELFADASGEPLEAFPEPSIDGGTTPTPPDVEDLGGAAYDDMAAAMTCGEYSIVTSDSAVELNEFNGETEYDWSYGEGLSPDGFPSRYRTFQFVLSDGGAKRYCGTVRVEKWFDDNPGVNRVRTMIDSRGYNNCSGDASTRYERGLRADY
jgi:hypothetical protein